MLEIISKKKYVNIILTRGDSAYITVNVTDANGEQYILQQGDHIHMQVRTRPNDGQLLFESIINPGDDYIWHIVPSDTNDLEIGEYYWDAQIELSNGDIFTFIPPSIFEITNEVTMHGK